MEGAVVRRGYRGWVLNFDVTRRPFHARDWRMLIGAVLAAQPGDEQDWLEWKSTLNLRSKEHIATCVAKAIIAMGNRDPDVAAQTVGGVGVLMVGVQPGVIHGVTPIDSATSMRRWSRMPARMVLPSARIGSSGQMEWS